ncbi:MAG: PHP domain-containing protein, partial [Candidatus Omnitrophica bacterium]|nr:PHP domain-containing protein [Candidatus Omnitrophota bacterium]
MNLLRGSIWRKWDLHIHTPASYDWDGSCNATAEDIVKKAITENLSVIAITDHHTVEGIDDIVKAAKGKNITILPGVELRTDKGNKGIHIIGVFDNSVTPKSIYDKLLCPLKFSEDDIKTIGDKQIYCNFEEACQKIHGLGGLVLLHAGQKSNGIEQLDSDIRATLKKDLASLVDIFEISAKKQVEDYRRVVFPKINQE